MPIHPKPRDRPPPRDTSMRQPASRSFTCATCSKAPTTACGLLNVRCGCAGVGSIKDIIGDIVYLLYANLYDLTRQTARVPGRDRPDARRVCASPAGFCCGLCRTL